LPAQIGRYEIRRELGRGTMGVVYEVHDPALHRTIALKTIRLAVGSVKERKEYERRFMAEARIAARLSHPGIVVVHDVGRDESNGILFIALEHLQGRTLAQMCDDGRPGWKEALRIVARVAEALDYAHGQKVVHRDVKPANIMVLPSGQPKIMDFGIAQLEAAHHTATGQFLGTPLFMAPEQALGQRVDGRTDIFSLGSVAYTLLTGRPPFEAPNVPDVLARVVHQQPAPVRERVDGLPEEAGYLLSRAMAKAPADRYPKAKMLAEDVEDVLGGRPPRHRAGWTPPALGDRTIASWRREAPLAEVELELLDDDQHREPAPRRRRPAPALVAVLMATAATYFYLHPADRNFWRFVLDTPPRLAAAAIFGDVAASPPRLPSRAASSAPSSAPPAPPAVTADPELGPVALATPEPFAPPQPILGEPAPATLVLALEHRLRRGRLKVWVDDRAVLDQDFKGRVVEESLALDPGQHVVRVQVSGDKNVKAARISGSFAAGATRRLDVEVGRPGAGNLGLAWK